MTHTFGNNKALPRSKIDNAILEIDQEMSVQNEKNSSISLCSCQ
jgi:hypothetical protein